MTPDAPGPRLTARGPDRRAVLAGLGAVVAGVSVASCGTGTGTGGSTTPTTGNGSSGPVDLGTTAAIPIGGGKIFDQELVVVTQPSRNDFKCFSAVCTHQGCTVSEVRDKTINCPCHGSQYSITDGSVVRGPAPRSLPAKQITVAGGTITLA